MSDYDEYDDEYFEDREEDDFDEEKCEKCGATTYADDVALMYDEDGILLCEDCFFEQESMRDLFDQEDDEGNYLYDEDDD